MKTSKIIILLSALCLLSLVPVAKAQQHFNVLRSFKLGSSEANTPSGSLTASGSVFYGLGYQGGSNNYGAVFKINNDGSGYTTLHSFSGGISDGATPQGSLLLIGSVLYGVTKSGGSNNVGTVFQINTDGTGFSLLHSFSGMDGSVGIDSLVVSGSTLYGVTTAGGSFGGGTIYKINTDGSGFTNIINFPANYFPEGSLTLSGSTLYGTTSYGGSSGQGTIYSVNTDGSAFSVLHNFAGSPSDGASPWAALTLSGSTLYGTTVTGGTTNGTVFRINTNGTGYSVICNLVNGPWGDSLTVIGSNLYGMDNGNSFIFEMSTNGSGYVNLHQFSGSPIDGAAPWGGLTLVGNNFFGMTSHGGSNNAGILFQINTNGSGYSILHNFGVGAGDGSAPQGSLTLSAPLLYGTTSTGGSNNLGVVFQINTNGTGYTMLHSFAGGTDGANPVSDLTISGSTLYGTTENSSGMIFSLNTTGANYGIIHHADASAWYDRGDMVLAGSTLYGATDGNGYGVVYKVNVDGSGFQVLHIFQGGATDGGAPGDLILIGSTLYGTTGNGGGTNNLGTVFSINTNDNSYSIIHAFTGGTNDGGYPNKLTAQGTTLYGTAGSGGANHAGTVFTMQTSGSGYTNLHSFGTGLNDGSGPNAAVTLSGSTLYGMTSVGGTSGQGTIFRMNTNGSGYVVLYSFIGGSFDGSSPVGAVVFSGSTLFGMTANGGQYNAGIIFSMPTWVLGSIPSTNINEQVLWQYTPTVSGIGYTFSLSNAPSGMTVNSSSGTLSWTPSQPQADYTYSNITYVVNQAGVPVASTNFNVTVNVNNTAPGFMYVFSPQTVYATTPLTVTDTATNSDIWATSLTYALVSAPSGVGIDPNTGIVTWTPTTGQVGTNTITVSATDYDPYAVNSQQMSVTNSFSVIVQGLTATSFTQSPSNAVVSVGQGFTFTAQATGYPPPTYQWQFSSDGVTYVNVNGATGSSYSIGSSSMTNIGYYRVVASNSVNSTNSAGVSLTFLSISMYAGLNILGPLGANYNIQAIPALYGSTWTTVTNISLPTQPYIYIDYNSPTNSKQFYRAVPQ